MALFDTHCHLFSDKYSLNPRKIIQEARQARVTGMCVVGYSVNSSRQAVDLAIKWPDLYVAVGIHPNEIEQHNWNDLKYIDEWALLPKVVAIGEIGLDLYRSPHNLEAQKKWFHQQLKIAQKHRLAVNIHCRDAYLLCVEILKEYPQITKIMHCFLGTIEQVRWFLSINCYISFSGVVTFHNAQELKVVVQAVPLNRLLLETDAPYLAPEPLRGKINYPKYLMHTARRIAVWKNISLEELMQITQQNAYDAYQITKK